MRKWRDLAAPDDSGAWYAVSRMWPTGRGTYDTADFSTGTEKTATNSAKVYYAFTARTLSGTREYVVDSGKLWEYSSGSLTDRTNGVSIGALGAIQMAQYGNITICVMGTSVATVSSSGGNFAALAGAPMGRIVVVHANAVVIFNTDTSADGWEASDVGDYTNWSSGENASGRIIEVAGPVIAAVSYAGHILVFKESSIYRMTYVGGAVKWTVQILWNGLGVNSINVGASLGGQYQAVATNHGVVFQGSSGSASVASSAQIYLYDGASQPVHLNPETTLAIPPGGNVLTYNPVLDVVTVSPALGCTGTGTTGGAQADASAYYYYSFKDDAWGQGFGSTAEDIEGVSIPFVCGVLQGDYFARDSTSNKPVYWRYKDVTTNAFSRCAPSAPGSSSVCFLQTAKIGASDFKTQFDRLIPLLRRRTDLGTDSASLEMTLFREREDTSAQTTRTISEASGRKRFDLNGSANVDNYARFKVTWTALDVEVDDYLVKSRKAGNE